MTDGIIFWGLGGAGIGVAGAFLLSRLSSRVHLRHAEDQASEWVQSAEEQGKAELEKLKLEHDEELEVALEKFERDHRKLVARNQEWAEQIADRQEELEEEWRKKDQARQKQEQVIRSRQGRVSQREAQIQSIRGQEANLQSQYQQLLGERAGLSIADAKAEICAELEVKTKLHANKMAQAFEEEYDANLERDAKRILQVALSRFARPYCPERGIGNVSFPSLEVKERTLGPNRQFLKALEKSCGVDISINEEYQSASILGYDPVRRELGRLTLERMLKEKNLSEGRIEALVQECKRDLFKKIINDGNRVAKELRVEGFAEEIRHMMGALRYRYSFAQNQHFHCAEVGFLCGLLAAELGVDVKDARRSGLLHDIGKAMDHSREGGHAVIGAEFIEKYGEKPHIVHAVRAHHFDEQPSSDLAYLVIAADAISGARPGARRSTMDSYTQKIADLQKIGDSFDGVIATYILSAGREVRIIVDSDRIDDHKALELSKQIARKIEDECSYPGLIKLTVVRETQAIEMAK